MLFSQNQQVPPAHEPDDTGWDAAPLRFHDLLRKTGLGIKLRFLVAMCIIAFFPVILLVVVFGNPSQQVFGRTTWLLLSGILLLTVLVATGVSLPIVRPIRRATRTITATTQEVRQLANDAQHIAQEHRVGTSILSGASKRLKGRRNSIVRDSELITQTCAVLQPRIAFLLQRAYTARDQQALELLTALQQGMQQISSLASGMASSFERDTSFEQLEKAMGSAQEISAQFDDASKQLEKGSDQLELAAASLI